MNIISSFHQCFYLYQFCSFFKMFCENVSEIKILFSEFYVLSINTGVDFMVFSDKDNVILYSNITWFFSPIKSSDTNSA